MMDDNENVMPPSSRLSENDLDQLFIWSGGCGPHCRRTGNTSIYHCPCKQCHG